MLLCSRWVKLGELHQPRCGILAPPSLGIDQDAHRLREGRGLHRPLAVVHSPSVEELRNLTRWRSSDLISSTRPTGSRYSSA
jgi:hypothetical protein